MFNPILKEKNSLIKRSTAQDGVRSSTSVFFLSTRRAVTRILQGIRPQRFNRIDHIEKNANKKYALALAVLDAWLGALFWQWT